MKFSIRRILLLALLGGAFLGSAYFAFVQWNSQRGLPDGLIQANGRIEGDAVTVASMRSDRSRGDSPDRARESERQERYYRDDDDHRDKQHV